MNAETQVVTFDMRHFQPVKFLGNGRFGHVFHYSCSATEEREFKDVAVKKLPLPEETFAAEGCDEIKTMTNLRHINVVKFLGYCKIDLQIAIVMELCAGDLQKIIASAAKLEVFDVGFLINQVCHGLAYLHGEGIIHRDIKPQNILVQCSNKINLAALASVNELILKISDFGLAKILDDDATSATMSVVGTRLYEAPEVRYAEYGKVHYSMRSDVYSLGLVTYNLLRKDLHELERVEDKKKQGIGAIILKRKKPEDPKIFSNFLSICLQYVPDKRHSSNQLLRHVFCTNVGQQEIEIFEGEEQKDTDTLTFESVMNRIDQLMLPRINPSNKLKKGDVFENIKKLVCDKSAVHIHITEQNIMILGKKYRFLDIYDLNDMALLTKKDIGEIEISFIASNDDFIAVCGAYSTKLFYHNYNGEHNSTRGDYHDGRGRVTVFRKSTLETVLDEVTPDRVRQVYMSNKFLLVVDSAYRTSVFDAAEWKKAAVLGPPDLPRSAPAILADDLLIIVKESEIQQFKLHSDRYEEVLPTWKNYAGEGFTHCIAADSSSDRHYWVGTGDYSWLRVKGKGGWIYKVDVEAREVMAKLHCADEVEVYRLKCLQEFLLCQLDYYGESTIVAYETKDIGRKKDVAPYRLVMSDIVGDIKGLETYGNYGFTICLHDGRSIAMTVEELRRIKETTHRFVVEKNSDKFLQDTMFEFDE